MAITRSQIAKQLLSNGGRIGFADGPPGGGETALGSGAAYSSGKKSSGTKEGRDVPTGRELAISRQFTPENLEIIKHGPDRRTYADRRDELALKQLELMGVPRSNLPGLMGIGLNVASPLRNIILKKNIDRYKKTATGPLTLSGYKQYMQDMRDRFTPEGDGQDQPIIPIFPETMMAQEPSIMDQEAEGILGAEDEGLRLRFMAEGGMLDEDTGRQMYGLGKLVKKAFKTVKKVAKSPIGKAAMLYFAPSLIPGGAATLGGVFKNVGGLGGIKAGLFGKAGVGSLGASLHGTGSYLPATSGILGKLGLTAGGGSMIPTLKGATAAISAVSLLPLLGIGTGEESEEEAEDLIRGAGLDINEIRSNPNKYLARRFRAEGGSMDEPVAKKTMPLLDMGGKEMDLRAEGGFVPIGRMEKADDVPARLSKNEFVFTADAVRNAGDGNVDKGAEVMYNMMKNLESGGDVSKESQGLEGARKMFQTSQRLEEVL